MDFASLPLTVGRAGRWIWNNVAPGLAISVVLVFVVTLAGEIYLRANTPSFVTEWPVVFDPQIGSRFRPNAEVATTNNRDYWTRQRASSIGFLDLGYLADNHILSPKSAGCVAPSWPPWAACTRRNMVGLGGVAQRLFMFRGEF